MCWYCLASSLRLDSGSLVLYGSKFVRDGDDLVIPFFFGLSVDMIFLVLGKCRIIHTIID
jgi:hypothetical protein